MSKAFVEGWLAEVTVDAEERAHGVQHDANRQRAVNLLEEYGAVVLRDVFERSAIEGLRRAIDVRYHLDDPAAVPANALTVGDRRFMISLELNEATGPDWLWGNPTLLLVLMELLGADMVLDSMTMVVAFPGAADQGQHRDNPLLFTTTGVERGISVALPTYAVSVAIPLIDLTPETGTTGLWYSSHHDPTIFKMEHAAVRPYIQQGSCYLVDYRLLHYGLANPSAIARPIIYLVFTRPWFTDRRNFVHQHPVTVTAEALKALPPVLSKLLRFVKPVSGQP